MKGQVREIGELVGAEGGLWPGSRPRVTLWEADGAPYPGATYGSALRAALVANGFQVEIVRLHERTPSADELAAPAHVLTGGTTPVVTGAGWVDDARRALGGVLDRAADGTARVVGICFGSQLVATALAGREAVRSCPNGLEAGLATVHSTEGRPDRTVAAFHFQEVVPQRLESVGGVIRYTNDHTTVQAYAVGDSVLGYQFHPELSAAALSATIWSHRPLLRALGRSPLHATRSIRGKRDRMQPDMLDELVLAPLLRVPPGTSPATLAEHPIELHDPAPTLAA